MARASATRWRWPPDSVMPRSPTTVAKPSGMPSRSRARPAVVAASRTRAGTSPASSTEVVGRLPSVASSSARARARLEPAP